MGAARDLSDFRNWRFANGNRLRFPHFHPRLPHRGATFGPVLVINDAPAASGRKGIIAMHFFDLACIAAIAALAASGAASAQTAPGATPVTAPAAAAPATLSITFTGIEAKQGTVIVSLYDEAGWNGGRPVRSEMVEAAGDTGSVAIVGLPAGRYGVKAFHDVNGNGRMDSNPFGMPTEPYAFSNDAKGQRGPASWADAAFDVAPGANAHTIVIR